MMMYLLGMGSTTHPLSADSWNAWKRTEFDFDGINYIGSYAPLFVHQFSQAWFDFRGKRDAYADYFQNSILATEVHKRFCISLSKKFPDYSDDLWGITASDSANGYQIWVVRRPQVRSTAPSFLVPPLGRCHSCPGP